MDCVAEAKRSVRQPVTVAGARLGTKPIVVPALIAANVLVFLITAIQAGSGTRNHASSLFADLALWPMLVGAGEWWRLVTSGFLHIGLAHLAMNMIALWVIGRDLEQLLGRVRFAVVYGLSLLGGSTAIFILGDPTHPVAGASGAVYGLMGGIAVAAFRLKVSLRPVLVVIALNVALTLFIPQISVLGHFGGLIIGVLAVAALLYAPRDRRLLWQGAVLAALLIVLVAAIITRDLQFGDLICYPTQGGTTCQVNS